MSFTLASSPLFFIVDEVGQFNKFSRMNNEKRKMLMYVLNENTDGYLAEDNEEWNEELGVYVCGKSSHHHNLTPRHSWVGSYGWNTYSGEDRRPDLYFKNGRAKKEQMKLWEGKVYVNDYADYIHPRRRSHFTKGRGINGIVMDITAKKANDMNSLD